MNLAPLIEYFAGERGQTPSHAALGDRRFLAALLTVREPDPIPEEVAARLDALLSEEAAARGFVEAEDVPTLAAQGIAFGAAAERMRLWRGDRTVLCADAIVNAANDKMLGCFTPGYHLPASYVIHTVGPIVPSHAPTAGDEAALASCYRSILDVADAHGDVRTVGFCAISTGVFGYPKDAGARVAIRSIRDWLTEHPDSRVEPLISAFTAADETIYLDAIREVLA